MSNKNISILFTGQGSQHENMGLDLMKEIKWVKDRYQLSSEILGYDVIKLQSDQSKINLTEFSQPLIFIYSSILIDIFKDRFRDSFLKSNLYLAGHSLGEYLALYFAETLNYEDMLRLVSIRGTSMAKVSDPNEFGMYAILTREQIDKTLLPENIFLANINSSSQVVICGQKEKLEQFKNNSKIGKFIPLNVSAPFHSPLMKESSSIFLEAAKSFQFNKVKYDILSNHNLVNYKDLDVNNYKNQLSSQIFSTVQWSDTINNYLDHGITEFYEIGPKKTLLKFIPKVDDIKTYPFCSYEDINNYV